MKIFTNSDFGYEGVLVSCETDIRRGIPAVDIVGLADGAVKETRERMKAAIRNQGLEFPMERVLMSLSPADLKKDGDRWAFPLALSVLDASNPRGDFHDQISVFAAGRMDLSGHIDPLNAVSQGLALAKDYGICYAVLPCGNRKESVPSGMKVHYTDSLSDAYYAIRSVGTDKENEYFKEDRMDATQFNGITFTDTGKGGVHLNGIKGNGFVKYAMAAAVAGKHNIIVSGMSGSGRTLLLQCMPEIMPDLLYNEYLQSERIYSLAGLVRHGEEMSRSRPFRAPHQTASLEGMYGGGVNLRPGEVSLANNGVLFLDEAAEFRTSVLQMLRVSLETRSITLARAGRSTVYPADFQLAMAVNPCPCGNYGSKDKICLCSRKSVELYWRKLSSPLMDRIEIRVDMNNIDKDFPDISTAELREKVKRAWEAQIKRGGFNGRLDLKSAVENIDRTMNEESLNVLEGIIEAKEKEWGVRRIANFKRLSRTVADMERHEEIQKDDLETALRLNTNLVIPCADGLSD